MNLKTGIPTFLVQQIIRQMLQGLDFLHTECHLIHTDLKPENIMAVIEDVKELVQACYTLEQMTCVSLSSTNQVVAVPSSSQIGEWIEGFSMELMIIGCATLLQVWRERVMEYFYA